MFDFLRGPLSHVKGTDVTLDLNGVGYRVHVHPRVLAELPAVGETLTLYTSHILRENFEALYGFCSRLERNVFEVLVSISGVGPKTGLALIGHLDLETMQKAVMQNDSATLSKVPGIGKKSAERLIIELKDKLPRLFSKGESESSEKQEDLFSPVLDDAISALINLGYSQAAARKALEKVMKGEEKTLSLADLITRSLKAI